MKNVQKSYSVIHADVQYLDFSVSKYERKDNMTIEDWGKMTVKKAFDKISRDFHLDVPRP